MNANTDTGVSSLDPLQGRAGCEGTFCYYRLRQAPASTGIANLGPELAQGAADSSGGW
jgi:hypothetical protein